MDGTTTERWQWLGSVVGDGSKPLDGAVPLRPSALARTANPSWGRASNRRGWLTSVACLFMITVPPALTVLSWIALESFDGSLSRTLAALFSDGLSLFAARYGPAFSPRASLGFAAWLLFQALLYTCLPGKSFGQVTPAGVLLDYPTNGLLAWVITVSLAVAGAYLGVLDPTVAARHWAGLIVIINIYGYALSVAAYIKAYYAPSHPRDRKFSGNALYDFLMGIELNPRFGKDWDWKLFHNGRPGIIGWSLIDLSYTAWQYQRYGYVTNSIVLVNIFHTVYIVDFFFNESWYLRTIDMAHDHFGFYLGWGSAVWLPTMYTLQVQYLARHPIQLSNLSAALILAVGVGGYALFRSVNHQKDMFRLKKGECMIWGKKAEFMRCTFKTEDGKTHESLLLMSGWWGISRHSNYVGDLMLSYAMCATCGLGHLLPWTYAIFMTLILVHRCYRDEKRLTAKYGDQWKQYCKHVPWRMIPGVW